MPKPPVIFVLCAISSWLAVVILTGCHTPITSSAPPSIGPDWQLQQGQALWRPAAGRIELAGELLLASHRTDGSFIEFAKPPVPWITAWQTPNAWQIMFPGDHRTVSGSGSPPNRWIWFQLPTALRGAVLPAPWTFRSTPDRGWRLENRKTGERLEGFLSP